MMGWLRVRSGSPLVQGNARLAAGNLPDEIERWRAEPGNGFIALGGATLAAAAAGSGLVETLTFSSKVVYLRYRVAR